MIEIGGLQKTTLIDYPGRLAATIFLIGCNFRCPFCYSPELVLPEKIKNQPRISEKYFFNFLKEKKRLLEGVVVCGGEPTINKKLPDFIKKIKKFDYLVKLDTNGSNPETLKFLINEKLIDYIAMDIKAPLELKFQSSNSEFQKNSNNQISKYKKATGRNIDTKKIKESIEMIKNSAINYEFRTTVVPVIHSKQDIILLANEIAPAKKYCLQNFRAEKTVDPKFERIKPYSEDFLLVIKKEIAHLFEICEVRN